MEPFEASIRKENSIKLGRLQGKKLHHRPSLNTKIIEYNCPLHDWINPLRGTEGDARVASQFNNLQRSTCSISLRAIVRPSSWLRRILLARCIWSSTVKKRATRIPYSDRYGRAIRENPERAVAKRNTRAIVKDVFTSRGTIAS